MTALLDVLLGSLMIFCWLGVLGMWRMREPMQALHYLALPVCGATVFLTAAVFLQTGNSQAAWKTLLICLVLLGYQLGRGPCHSARLSRPRTWSLATARRRSDRVCARRERLMIWCGAGILLLLAISGFAGGAYAGRDRAGDRIRLLRPGHSLDVLFLSGPRCRTLANHSGRGGSAAHDHACSLSDEVSQSSAGRRTESMTDRLRLGIFLVAGPVFSGALLLRGPQPAAMGAVSRPLRRYDRESSRSMSAMPPTRSTPSTTITAGSTPWARSSSCLPQRSVSPCCCGERRMCPPHPLGKVDDRPPLSEAVQAVMSRRPCWLP